MKKTILVFFVVLSMVFFLGTNMGLAQDTPKSGCPKQACFDKMDTDKDGKITETEFLKKCRNRFNSMDADKDGSLSKEEFKSGCMKKKWGKGCPHGKGSAKE